jgi:hypothetical protein
MSEDEGLVERVSRACCFAQQACGCDGPADCQDWGLFDVHAAAGATIAAVRAWDAEHGMVTVPREPTEAMLDVAGDEFDWGPPGYCDAPQGAADPDPVYRALHPAAGCRRCRPRRLRTTWR